MIKAKEHGRPTIDLTGSDGNAFALLGHAQRFAKQLKLDYRPIMAEMQSGDYENLVNVFEKHFGHVVVLLREAPDSEYDYEADGQNYDISRGN